jgi:hypothetical protein
MKLNPNSEFRVPKEIRSSKTEAGRFTLQDRRIFGFNIGQYSHSDFGLLSGFGLSDFGFQTHPSWVFDVRCFQL